jgi:hypothetical protein
MVREANFYAFRMIEPTGVRMAGMTYAVYDPPNPGLPFLAVVFHGNEVFLARPVSSVDEGEGLIAHFAQEMAKRKKAAYEK